MMALRGITLIVVLIAWLSVRSLAAGIQAPRGMQITQATGRTVAFTYRPVVSGWDTIATDGGHAVRPRIADAELRQAADGSIVTWVVRFSLPVPGPDAFHVQYRSTAKQAHTLPLVREHGAMGALLQTLPPVHGVEATYIGIARDHHYADVAVEVARWERGTTHTQLRSIVEATITFDRPVLGTRSGKRSETLQETERLGTVYAMRIDREGIYRLTADDLRARGIPTDAATATSLKIMGRGGMELSERVSAGPNDSLIEQPIIVRTNADGSIREVLFYASGPAGWTSTKNGIRHYIHHYDRASGYLLTYGGKAGRRATANAVITGDPHVRPTRTVGRVYFEDELTNPYSSGSGRRWFGRSIEQGGAVAVTTLLPGLLRDGRIQYVLSAAHRSTRSGVVTVAEQGTTVAQIPLTPVADYMDSFNDSTVAYMPASVIAADGRSVLRFSYTSTDRSASGFIDYAEVHYPRELQANGGEFELWADQGDTGIVEWSVNGFGTDILAWDVTNPSMPVLMTNTATTGGLAIIRDSVKAPAYKRFVVASTFRNASLERITWVNLRTDLTQADVLVITHPSLKRSADAYAAYREGQGELSVSVVTTDQIFNEFSFGITDPTAIRNFLQHAYNTWDRKPRYVLLWGDGHFDYKNISTSAPNYVIPFESIEPVAHNNGLFTRTVDDFFARLAGDDALPEVALGRLPVTSNDVGQRLLDRIRSYEHQSSVDDWRTRVTLVADDGQTTDDQTDRDLHLSQSETLASDYLPPTMQPRKIYMVEYPTENVPRGRRKPTVTDDLLSTINTQGSLIVNWIGHGNPRVWAHEQIFVRENTVPLMTNSNKLFFVTAATCDFARFDLPDNQSGAEELILAENGGAIGVFSASRVVLAYANAAINQEFYRNLFQREATGAYSRVGDAYFRTKLRLNGDNDEKFLLLGDPTVRLLVPNERVVIDSVNGVAITNSTSVQLQALSTVRVSGHVTGPLGDRPDRSFRGVATISLFDSDVDLSIRDNDKNQTLNSFRKMGAALNRSSYRIEDGRFTAAFVIPKDISFSTQQGKLFVYAIDDSEERFAKGVTDRVTIGGVGDQTYDDDEGPSIAVYLDSRSFRPGEFVRRNPILIVDLADATGINTTGVGIGHDIEADINDGLMVENLTPTFATSLANSRAGTATKQLFNLQPGLHTVRVRAWDVLNNVSEAVTSFRVADAATGSFATSLEAWPNPFTEQTTIVFKHTIDRPFNASIRIHDISGRLVFERAVDVTAMQTAEIPWDGRDADGSLLSSGAYHAVAVCTLADGSTITVGGNITLLR
jgi:hypothetical protein